MTGSVTTCPRGEDANVHHSEGVFGPKHSGMLQLLMMAASEWSCWSSLLYLARKSLIQLSGCGGGIVGAGVWVH